MVIAFFKGFLLAVVMLFLIRAMGFYMVSDSLFMTQWEDAGDFLIMSVFPGMVLGQSFAMHHRRKQKAASKST